MQLFYDVYKVRSGDNLYALGRRKGFENPGPIVAFPPNQALFKAPMTPNLLPVNTMLRVPWHPLLLQKLIVTSEWLIRETSEFAAKLIEQQVKNKEDLEHFLVLIDSINMIAQIHVSVGALAAEHVAHDFEMSSEKILGWLADNRVHLLAGDMAPLVIPTPTAPKKDFRFYIRHSLGPWTPSFWTSVYAAIREKDLDLYLYGSDAITYRTAHNIKTQADRDIAKLTEKVSNARWQMSLPFNSRHI